MIYKTITHFKYIFSRFMHLIFAHKKCLQTINRNSFDFMLIFAESAIIELITGLTVKYVSK